MGLAKKRAYEFMLWGIDRHRIESLRFKVIYEFNKVFRVQGSRQLRV